MGDGWKDLLKEWDEPVIPPGLAQYAVQAQLAAAQAKIVQTLRSGELKIAIERINNGWLVNLENLSGRDPLGSQTPNGKNFADTPEAICGMIAEWVLAECNRQERNSK